ncbi:flagellar hook-basal body complex protein FliE [bacterium]|jgi:flagellar hook-basal body complex protein FliE|nr:flagellar hook-basal body complex protein FliE [bacterium]
MSDIPIGIRTLPNFPQNPREVPQLKPTVEESSFGDTLSDFIQNVNELQKVSAEKTLAFATGQIQDIHEVMTASTEAGIAMQLLIEMRNKVVDAYRELMRMQI